MNEPIVNYLRKTGWSARIETDEIILFGKDKESVIVPRLRSMKSHAFICAVAIATISACEGRKLSDVRKEILTEAERL